MKVIVLGAGGFIGSNLVRAFPDWVGVLRNNLDLTDQKAVDAYFENVDCDNTVVVHCAVIGGSRLRPDDGDVAYKNILMFENVARHAKKMIYFSSGAALRGNPPTDPYGLSKWVIDKRIEMLGNGYHSLRIWGCYGEGELPTRFSAVCREKGHVVIPQDRYFDFIDVKDVCKIVKKFVDGGPRRRDRKKFYNLVYSGEKMLLSEWAMTEFGATSCEIENYTSLGESYCAPSYVHINRSGYGSVFNNIYIDYTNFLFKKSAKNDYGIKKLRHEIDFYKFITDNNISFPVPKIISGNDNNHYIMPFLYNYEPLYKNLENLKILESIKKSLSNLHNSSKIIISKTEYIKELQLETNEKIINRYSDNIKISISKYSFIKKVNNLEILPFDEILKQLNVKLLDIVDGMDEYALVPIHGDCQFNNIMYNKHTRDFVFIDPRGYFGSRSIYGIEEYDEAKILFALSGYDLFDEQTDCNIDITNDNINIDINILDYTIFDTYKSKLSIYIMASIWLGNPPMFNNNKCIYSYFLALYFGTIVLKSSIK